MAGETGEMEVLMVALRELLVERDADIDKLKVGCRPPPPPPAKLKELPKACGMRTEPVPLMRAEP